MYQNKPASDSSFFFLCKRKISIASESFIIIGPKKKKKNETESKFCGGVTSIWASRVMVTITFRVQKHFLHTTCNLYSAVQIQRSIQRPFSFNSVSVYILCYNSNCATVIVDRSIDCVFGL